MLFILYPMSIIDNIEKILKAESKNNLINSHRFFKTDVGEYAEKDVFLGISSPFIRNVVKKYRDISYDDLNYFMQSPIHEYRLFAVLVLVYKYKKEPDNVYNFYISKIDYVNNWDIVDLSTPHIIGEYILKHSEDIRKIEEMCIDSSLWKRRISVLATFPQIKKGEFDMAFRVIKRLLGDKEDLIHKACGWALREVYKKDTLALEKFLQENYSSLPRTTLRYAIERMDEVKRKEYLKGEF